MENKEIKDFIVSVDLLITGEKRESYSSNKDIFKTNVKKTLVANSSSKREDFLAELKVSIEEVWNKANNYFKQRDDVFENEVEKEETF